MSEKKELIECYKRLDNTPEVTPENGEEYLIVDAALIKVYATFKFNNTNEVVSVKVRITDDPKNPYSIKKMFYCQECKQFEVSIREGEKNNSPQTYYPKPSFLIEDEGIQVMRIKLSRDEKYEDIMCFDESDEQPQVRRGLIITK
jgi:hypothetical protein